MTNHLTSFFGHGPSFDLGHGPSFFGHGPLLFGHGPSCFGHGPSFDLGHGPSFNHIPKCENETVCSVGV